MGSGGIAALGLPVPKFPTALPDAPPLRWRAACGPPLEKCRPVPLETPPAPAFRISGPAGNSPCHRRRQKRPPARPGTLWLEPAAPGCLFVPPRGTPLSAPDRPRQRLSAAPSSPHPCKIPHLPLEFSRLSVALEPARNRPWRRRLRTAAASAAAASPLPHRPSGPAGLRPPPLLASRQETQVPAGTPLRHKLPQIVRQGDSVPAEGESRPAAQQPVSANSPSAHLI